MSDTPARTVVTIAGIDPSGGAGVLADVKTFSALGTYGTGVIAALTAQSTQGVTGFTAVDPAFVREQWTTLADDILPDAMKIGMLATVDVAAAVSDIIDDYRDRVRAAGRREAPVILDPVMVATSGDRLVTPETEQVIRELMRKASLVTPNLPEAATLLGEPTATAEGMRAQALALRDVGAERVLLKGGHLDGEESIDLYADGREVRMLRAPRIPTTNTHGTGCTLSSAVAALRATGADWGDAVEGAKRYLTSALRRADELHIGSGRGPVHHFWNQWEQQ